MKKGLPKLSDGNLEIMKIIWDMNEASVLMVLNEINKHRQKKIGRTSVLVQLTRLREYGWLKTRKEGRTFYYSATINKKTATQNIVYDIKERVFGGSHSDMIRHLFDDKNISKSELDEIKTMINDYDRGK